MKSFLPIVFLLISASSCQTAGKQQTSKIITTPPGSAQDTKPTKVTHPFLFGLF